MSSEHRAAEAIIDSCLLNEDIQLFNAPGPGSLHISPSKLIKKFTEAKKTVAPSLKKTCAVYKALSWLQTLRKEEPQQASARARRT